MSTTATSISLDLKSADKTVKNMTLKTHFSDIVVKKDNRTMISYSEPPVGAIQRIVTKSGGGNGHGYPINVGFRTGEDISR